MTDLVKVAEALAAPAQAAIDKLAAGASKIYEPTHLRRMAKANLDQELIDKITDHDIQRIESAAKNRLAYRHLRQEINITKISDRAAVLLSSIDSSNTTPPEDEWVDEFTDQCADSSSDELRELWSRIFVEQTTKPNAIPRRVLRVVRDLDASLAKSFNVLLGCGLITDDGRRIVVTFKDWYKDTGILPRNLRELEDVGLIVVQDFNTNIGGGAYRFIDKIAHIDMKDKNFEVGIIQMTSAGIALARVAESKVNIRYLENLTKYVQNSGGTINIAGAEKKG